MREEVKAGEKPKRRDGFKPVNVPHVTLLYDVLRFQGLVAVVAKVKEVFLAVQTDELSIFHHEVI